MSTCVRSVVTTNNRQRLLVLHALRRRFDLAHVGLNVGFLGLAFKPGTDDVRYAPSLDLIRALVAEGVAVRAYDARGHRVRASAVASAGPACGQRGGSRGRRAVLGPPDRGGGQIVNADWRAVARRMTPPRFVFDGRNALDPGRMENLGFEYVGVGRAAARRTNPVNGAATDGADGARIGIRVVP